MNRKAGLNLLVHAATEAIQQWARDIKKGVPFVWECHDCREGVAIPGTQVNIHGKKVKIDPNNLDPNTEVMRF